VKDSAHAPIPGPNSAAAVVAAVYPKNVRRLLAILVFLYFPAIVIRAAYFHPLAQGNDNSISGRYIDGYLLPCNLDVDVTPLILTRRKPA
jgi:hypothetical protein